MQSLYDLSLTGLQIHNEAEDGITWTSDGKVYVGDVDQTKIKKGDAQVFVGGEVVIESTRVEFNFACTNVKSVGR